MKIKKVACAALMLSLPITLSAYVLENKSSAYEEGAGSSIEVVRRPELGDKDNYPAMILKDTETGVEYIYIADGSGCAISPRLNRNGQPFSSK